MLKRKFGWTALKATGLVAILTITASSLAQAYYAHKLRPALLPDSASECKFISDHDIQDLCLGVANKDLENCAYVGDHDTQELCVGVVEQSLENCTLIEDRDIRQLCVGIVKRSAEPCDSINDLDAQNLCLEIVNRN